MLLVDTDTQGSASDWISFRDQQGHLPRIESFQKFGTALAGALRDAAKRYDDIIVDAGGKDSVELRSAMTVCDLLISPVQASSFDLWTLGKLNELYDQASPINPALKILMLVNRGSTNPRVKDGTDAMSFIDEYESLQRATTEIHDRVIYRRAAVEGKGVVEKEDEQAIREMEALYAEVYGND